MGTYTDKLKLYKPIPGPEGIGERYWGSNLNANQDILDIVAGSVVNVLDPQWGIKCDGVTDDSTALQALVTALPSSGATVLIPPGSNCLFSSEIAITGKSNLTIIGYGATMTWTKAATSGSYAFQIKGTSGTHISNIKLLGLTFTMNRVRTTTTNTGMILILYADDVLVEDVRVLRHDTYPLVIRYGNNIKVLNNTFGSYVDNYGDSDDKLGHGPVIDGNVVRFMGNFVGNIYDNGLHLTHTTTRNKDNRVIDNTFRNMNIGAGIFAEAIDGLILAKNNIYDTGDAGIYLADETSPYDFPPLSILLLLTIYLIK